MTDDARARSRVGERIRRLREDAGLSLREVAQLADISPMQLSRVERLESSPTAEKIESLAEALDVHPGYLFGGEDVVTSDILAKRTERLRRSIQERRQALRAAHEEVSARIRAASEAMDAVGEAMCLERQKEDELLAVEDEFFAVIAEYLRESSPLTATTVVGPPDCSELEATLDDDELTVVSTAPAGSAVLQHSTDQDSQDRSDRRSRRTRSSGRPDRRYANKDALTTTLASVRA